MLRVKLTKRLERFTLKADIEADREFIMLTGPSATLALSSRSLPYFHGLRWKIIYSSL